MIGYVTLGTNDLPKAATFYDAVAGAMGFGRMMEEGEFIAWGDFESGTAGIAATKPFDEQAATVGNGTMVALMVDSPIRCRRFTTLRLLKVALTKAPQAHAAMMAFMQAISATSTAISSTYSVWFHLHPKGGLK